MAKKKKTLKKAKKPMKKKALKKEKKKAVKKAIKRVVKKVKKTKKVKKVKAMKKKPAKAKSEGKVIGKVTHYYDHIGVGVLSLKSPLSVGDSITLKRGEHKFSQVVESLQIDHENVPKATKGQEVGLKLKEPIKGGALVLKV